MRLILMIALATQLVTGHAAPTVVSVNLEQNFESPRWMYDARAKTSSTPLIQNMIQIKKTWLGKEIGACLAAVDKAYVAGKSLGPWIAWNHLQCAQWRDKKGRVNAVALKAALDHVDRDPRWMLAGPASQLLRSAYTSGLLVLAEQQLKTDRRAAWKSLDRLQQLRSWLSAEDRANAYRIAGELAFIEQNLAVAQDFLLRSLNEKDNPELRSRMESIRSSLLGKKDSGDKGYLEPAIPVEDELGMSDQEREFSNRMKRAYDSQDYISAIEDGVELIQKFPGSRRSAEASDLILDIYLSVSAKTEEKFRHVRERIVKDMLKADPARLSRWAQNAYARGSYLDALTLAEKAHDRYNGHPDSTKIALLAAEAAHAAGEYKYAQKFFEILLVQHAGTNEAAEATFRLGLLEYRKKRYPQAAAFFERLLVLNHGKNWEHRALYWQWRAQQRIDAENSKPYAERLIAKYPLSYYGIRAQAETNGGELQLKAKGAPLKVELRLMQSELLAWERLNVLLKAGWFREAEKELEFLPEPNTNEERLLRAKLWSAAMRYDMAIQVLNKAIEENPEYMRINVLKVVFPNEFADWIGRESKLTGLDANWIRSLIRQESSFRPEVKSPANAMGVMQLLPATGQEIARDLKVKEFTSPDSLLIPEINIKLGSVYLSRLLRGFSGNMPLALAAYNAGPTRLRRWLSARRDLSGLEAASSSAPEVEVWIDELPWEETSQYVKAILRNWLVYRLMDGSKLSLSEPIWVDAKPSAR